MANWNLLLCVSGLLLLESCLDTYCRYEYNNQSVGCDNFSITCLLIWVSTQDFCTYYLCAKAPIKHPCWCTK